MRPSDAANAVASLIEAQVPGYLWGAPGIGKSCIVKQVARKLGLDMIDIRAVLLDPVDLRGLPHINGGGKAHWALPSFLPTDGRGILFLDELAQAPPLVQSACLQLTLDRRIGEYVLPDGWSIVAASNRQEDRAGAHRLISPLLNRFIHLDVEVSHDDWFDWAVTNGVSADVWSFIGYRRSQLHDFQPNSGARAFPTPRSWEFVSKVLPHTTPATRMAVVAGAVGDGAAAEFESFLKIRHNLPDVKDIFKDPDHYMVPKEASVLYALSGSMIEFYRDSKNKAKDGASLLTYANRMQKEICVLTVRNALRLDPSLIQSAAGTKYLKENKQYINA